MKLSIKQKLILSFIIVSLLFSASSFFAYLNMKNTVDSYDYLLRTVSELKDITQEIQSEVILEVSNYRAYMLYGNKEYKEKFNDSQSKINSLIEEGKSIATLQETKDRLDALELANNQFQQTANPIIDLLTTDKQAALDKGLEVIPPIATNLINDVDSLYTWLQQNVIEPKEKETQKNAEAGVKQVIIMSIGATLIAIIAGIFLSGIISKPIRLVMEQMGLIANGDLSKEPLKVKTKDEIGQLVLSTNEMAKSMRSLLTEINTVSETVSSQSEELTQSADEVMAGADQVNTTMQELAAAAETQANSATELSNLMGEFVSSTKEASEKGESIRLTANKVLHKTIEGGQLMQSSTLQMDKIDGMVRDTVQKVNNLDTQSKEISKLVVVIKDIADQTNLLALNAAIEAARAGEQGKGFAVVADEVRKLAEQVAVSVNDITNIVTNIQSGFSLVNNSLHDGYKEVEKGTEQIQTTEKTFKEINESITDMVSNIILITESLKDISTNSQEMNKSIEDIAAASEESAAGVEQTSASVQQTNSSMHEVTSNSNDLAQLAEKLNNLIAQFKL